MISTHILDTSKGLPAAMVEVQLQYYSNKEWITLEKKLTNSDGRIVFDADKGVGAYQLIFHAKGYFKNEPSFYQDIPIVFYIEQTNRKYHVPLLLNPYGYSTYRGS